MAGQSPAEDNATPDDESVTGYAVDQDGNPVANVSVGTYWNANGLTKVRLQKLQDEEKENGTEIDNAEMYAEKGIMEPWGDRPTTTDEQGRFTAVIGGTRNRILVIDEDQQRGALLAVSDSQRNAPITLRLQPLIRVYGEVRVDGQEDVPKWAVVLMNIPRSDECPLGPMRMAMCGTIDGRFEFRMPPGEYVFESNNDWDLEEHAQLVTQHRFVLKSGQKEYNADTLILTPKPIRENRVEAAKKSGNWFDFREHYGEPAPQLLSTEVRGAADNVQPADYKGKWLLIYAWAPWCNPCLAKGIPKLMAFQDEHADKANEFQILSVCIDADNDLGSLEELDEYLGPVIRKVWKRPLNVPILFDTTFQNFENYGFVGAGDMALIDPDGNLVVGDLETLDAILAAE